MDAPTPSEPGGDQHDIVVTLRDGSEHMLVLDDPDRDASHILDEVRAERSQLLRGWVTVRAADATRALVRGEEITQLRLVPRAASE